MTWVLRWMPDGSPPPHQLNAIAPGLGMLSPAPVHDDGWVLVGHARLDARHDVARRLGCASTMRDEELLLAAYRAWGETAFQRLRGEWSVALWQENERRLVLTRGPLGLRPLFFALLPKGGLVAGDRIEAVVALLNTFPRPNWAYLRDIISGNAWRMRMETAWHGVYRLPGGFLLEAHPRAERPRRVYWFGEHSSASTTRLENVAGYTRLLLEEAVRIRLPRNAAVVLHGDLASAILAGTAAHLHQEGSAPAGRWIRLHTTYPPTAATHLEALECRFPRETLVVPHDPLDFPSHTWRTLGNAPLFEPMWDPMLATWAAIATHARAHGVQALLWSDGGTAVLGGMTYSHGTFLRDWGFWHWPIECWHASRAGHLAPGCILRQALLPERLARLLGRQRPLVLPTAEISPTWGGKRLLAALFSPTMTLRLEFLHLLRTRLGITSHTPFLDLAFVEHMASLPAHLLARHGTLGWLARLAFADRIPATLRTFPSALTPLTVRGVVVPREMWDDVRDLLAHTDLAHVLPPGMQARLHTILDAPHSQQLWLDTKLFALLSVAAWLHTYEESTHHPAAFKALALTQVASS